MDLKDLRKNIDVIDSKILKLLNSRMELALRAKREKVHIEDGVREKEVLEKIERKTPGLIDKEFTKKLFEI